MSGADELARRQALLAAILQDPALEGALRRDPNAIAREHDVAPEFARGLARLSPARLSAFRRSAEHKQDRRRVEFRHKRVPHRPG